MIMYKRNGAEQVHLSAVEIYCERIRDLLACSEGRNNLAVTNDKDRGIVVAGAHQELLHSPAHLLQMMQVLGLLALHILILKQLPFAQLGRLIRI